MSDKGVFFSDATLKKINDIIEVEGFIIAVGDSNYYI